MAFAVQLNKPLDVQVRSAKEVRAVITWEPAARDEKADSHSAENPTNESTQIVGFAKQAMVMLARSAIRAERHFQGALNLPECQGDISLFVNFLHCRPHGDTVEIGVTSQRFLHNLTASIKLNRA